MIARRLLLVHQDELFRHTAALTLGLVSGGRVDEAGDSVTGQYMMLAQSYDALVLDLDEGEAAQVALDRLRSSSFLSGPRTPVLLLATAGLGAATRETLEAGPHRVLFKPVRVQDVAHAVQDLQSTREAVAG